MIMYSRAATKIQLAFRGKVGRAAADREAERRMFFKAEEEAKAKALAAVEDMMEKRDR